MLKARVLVVEDEPDLLANTVHYLNLDGFVADGVDSLGGAEAWLTTHEFDLLVLDLGLPDGDGLHWLQGKSGLRGKGVVVTTARGEERQRISGIQQGADLYLVKPVSLEELSSLMHNLWRRIKGGADTTWVLQTVGWMLVSPLGVSVKLTHNEQLLMRRLAHLPGQAVSRAELAVSLGQDADSYDYRRLEILVRRLRAKVQEQLGMELPLETAPRVGYAFVSPLRVS